MIARVELFYVDGFYSRFNLHFSYLLSGLEQEIFEANQSGPRITFQRFSK